MRVTGTTLAVCVLLGSTVAAADAAAPRASQDQGPSAAKSTRAGEAGRSARRQTASSHGYRQAAASRAGQTAYAASTSGGISCVPYARSVTGMAVRGNGGDWWRNAAGSYDRGNRPEPGSVMAFRATGGMSRGHVAVVGRVLGPRHVLIDHANWGGPGIRKGSIMHNVNVVDVSENNDWTAVRVQSGYDQSAYGRVYPTYGFIYNRPDGDTGTAYAAARPLQRSFRFEQVAEMPLGAHPVSFQPQGHDSLRRAAPQRHR